MCEAIRESFNKFVLSLRTQIIALNQEGGLGEWAVAEKAGSLDGATWKLYNKCVDDPVSTNEMIVQFSQF